MSGLGLNLPNLISLARLLLVPLEIWLILAIPFSFTFTFGRMARDQKQGWVVFGTMLVLWLGMLLIVTPLEAHGNSKLTVTGASQAVTATQSGGNMEGKELRFGPVSCGYFAASTTSTSDGAVNCQHDSLTPLGGGTVLVNMMYGEVSPGGTGSGLFGMLIFALLAVFIAGLMVGRTPEYLGKKIEGREMKLAMLYVLIFPLVILGFSAWSAVSPYGLSSLNNGGPRGLMEILYAYSSGAGNNGSAYAGLNANTPWYNISLGLDMLAGRFLMIVPALGIAGSMVGKKVVPPSLGTFPTNGSTFAVLLVSVVVIVGALTFFPALSLGNIIEHFAAVSGKVF